MECRFDAHNKIDYNLRDKIKIIAVTDCGYKKINVKVDFDQKYLEN